MEKIKDLNKNVIQKNQVEKIQESKNDKNVDSIKKEAKKSSISKTEKLIESVIIEKEVGEEKVEEKKIEVQISKPVTKKKQKGKIVSIKPATVRIITEDGRGMILSKNLFINNKINDIVEF